MASLFLFQGLERVYPAVHDEEEMLPFDEMDHETHEHWERLLARHALVREARSFARSCSSLGRDLGYAIVPDREMTTLARYARRLPQTLAEALVAEVNGREHRDCDAECVGYDIACLGKTREGLLKSLAILERLLARYPHQRHKILALTDQAAEMETNVSARIIAMTTKWLQKQG